MNVTIDGTTLSLIADAVRNTFQSLLSVITLLIAVPLAFYISRKILALIPK